MLSLSNISVIFGSTPLFEGLDIQINPKERIALAGRNGAGKTTLLNLIAGKTLPTQGSISYPTDLTIGYLPQHLLTQDTQSLREEVKKAFSKELEIKHRVETLSQELGERTDYDTPEYLELVQRLSNATELLTMYNTAQMEAEIEKTLKGLGFSPEDLGRDTSEFSGGWRMRIELAKILLGRPDILLLDEPTNHLDLESIIWLENFIQSTPAAVIMVSHDRAFLDRTTTRTIELSLGKAFDYKASYSHYLNLREERVAQQQRAYENQQKLIQETEEFIERFRYKATKAVQVQSRIKQLDKIDRIEVEEIDRRRIHFRFPMTTPSGAYPLTVEGLGVSYGDLQVLSGLDLVIKRGEKVALVGKNGSGKTTFVKSVMGQTPFSGEIKLGHQVQVSYFAQNQAALLPPELTIYETVDAVAVGEVRTRINDILGAFMFGGEISEKKVSVLSGGERSRLAMIHLLLSPSNLLILDEPTNHLDLSSKAVLKEAIRHYEGTVLLVSHDRDFLDGLVDYVVEFREQKAITHLGGMEEYLRKLQERTTPSSSTPTTTIKTESEGRIEYEKQKELQRKRKRVEQEILRCEKEIEEKEAEKACIETSLSQGETSPDLLEKYHAIEQKLRLLLDQWEQNHETLAEFND